MSAGQIVAYVVGTCVMSVLSFFDVFPQPQLDAIFDPAISAGLFIGVGGVAVGQIGYEIFRRIR